MKGSILGEGFFLLDPACRIDLREALGHDSIVELLEALQAWATTHPGRMNGYSMSEIRILGMPGRGKGLARAIAFEKPEAKTWVLWIKRDGLYKLAFGSEFHLIGACPWVAPPIAMWVPVDFTIIAMERAGVVDLGEA